MKKKLRKKLNKRCPECGGMLELFDYMEDRDGVGRTESWVECVRCDFSDELKNKKNRRTKSDEDNNDNS
jgi:Zn ribbon nucleic-acid-binding protein